MPSIKVASAHVAPVFLNLPATIEKTCSIIAEAAGQGAQLIAFPETFVPAFPVWSALRAPIHNHELFRRLVAQSMLVQGPEMARLRAAARRHDILVSLGFNEANRGSVGCLHNSNVLIGHDGAILNHHRKLMPTFYEKLTWSPGDGAGLRVSETRCGRLGMLICGENTNPLARYTLIAQGEQIHISTYPPVWPTHPPGERNYDLAHAIRLRAGAHSFEGKVFNIVSSGFMDQAMFEELARLHPEARAILEASPRGISVVTGPGGTPVSRECCSEEDVVYAEIDPADCVEPKQFHDISGGYNRFDVFRLTVDRTPLRPVRFTSHPESAAEVDGSKDRQTKLTLSNEDHADARTWNGGETRPVSEPQDYR
jgi:predicted amidohydrolase